MVRLLYFSATLSLLSFAAVHHAADDTDNITIMRYKIWKRKNNSENENNNTLMLEHKTKRSVRFANAMFSCY